MLKNYYEQGQNKLENDINCRYNVYEEVIIHIHGGGWCAMSSYSHQCYTRKWALNHNLKDVPIFSIDYRKTPKNCYPDGKNK